MEKSGSELVSGTGVVDQELSFEHIKYGIHFYHQSGRVK